MNIEIAKPEYANQLSELVISASKELQRVDFNEEGWKRFLFANTPNEIEKKLGDYAFKVFCCKETDRILGFIAIKDDEKVDQLFVLPEARGKGVARLLWESAKSAALENGASGNFWVRSSSLAVPVYKKFGFEPEGERQVFGGICFQLMRIWLISGQVIAIYNQMKLSPVDSVQIQHLNSNVKPEYLLVRF